jgi:hybrid polyketide synthase/nonribosomal peptide synthetase ACE1
VHQIDNIARTHSQETAIWLDNNSTTYAELNSQVNAIASALANASVAVGSTVAVMMEPSAAFIASLLGVQRAGAVYLPLELSWPWPRLASVVADCQPSVVLVDDASLSLVDNLKRPGLHVIKVSRLDKRVEPIAILASAKRPAALLYTSGSSGVPKGIFVKHEGLRNWTEHAIKLYNIDSKAVVLQQTTPTFDISLIQILAALCVGGSLCLIPRQHRGDAQAISKVMSSHHVTLTCATPSEYAAWLHFGGSELGNSTTWKSAFSIGEPIPVSLMAQIRSAGLKDLSFYNLYGPTEASLAATGMLVPAGLEEGPIAAGTPLPNYSVYVLDEQLRLVPVGIQGEVYIGGAGVGLGYHNRPEQTARMFVPNVFATPEDKKLGWETMHRTGDLGRWREDGMLLIEGRIDTQVKIRGLRIDLSEVEHAIMNVASGAVREVAVTPRELPSDQSTILVAHAVFEGEADVASKTSLIQSRLSERLPQYMCPAIIIGMDQLPRTNAAKLDRRSLATLPLDLETANLVGFQAEHDDQVALTPTETQLRDIWVQILGLRFNVAANTDFFHIGGSSILLLKLQKRISDVFGVRMPLVSMFRASTVRAMADWVDHGARDTADEQHIDWKQETSLPSTVLELDLDNREAKPSHSKTTSGLTVILTGATGKLGSGILKSLVDNTSIQRVHCIGVRNVQERQSGITGALGNNATKVTIHPGDLGLPRLGLSEEEASGMFASADILIHNGSDMSYLKTYATLRAVNLQSTKNLAEMCALYASGKHIPIHYVSTVSVGNVATWTAMTDDDGSDANDFVLHPVSVADHDPPPVATLSEISKTAYGYIASKWASEVFLERLHQRHPAWPVVIHRPSLISREEEDTDKDAPVSLEFVDNMRRYAALLNAVPAMPSTKEGGDLSVCGAFDVVPIHKVVEDVTASVMQQDQEGLKFLHHLGGFELRLDDVQSWLPKDRDEGTVQEIELGKWTRMAVSLGMHPTMASLLVWMGSANGRLVIPRNVSS